MPQNLSIKASNVSIVFTDLKSSTELYEKTGDYKAYNLVQAHFDVLKAIVEKYNGAVIKTIGDAIMASFSESTDTRQSARLKGVEKETIVYQCSL